MQESEWEELLFLLCLRWRIWIRRNKSVCRIRTIAASVPRLIQVVATTVERRLSGCTTEEVRTAARRRFKLDEQEQVYLRHMDRLEANSMEEAADAVCRFGLRVWKPDRWVDW